MKLFKNNYISKILGILGIVFCLAILLFSLRGLPGTPNATELNNKVWKDAGPLELSPERGRFALTYSLIEDKSFQFSLPVARFATPDLGYWNGNYVSLFAPGLSMLIIPGYVLGKSIGLSQVGSFAIISLFAVLNFVLIRGIAGLLGANRKASFIAGLAFLFATPAFAYAVTLYQHHISTFLILLSTFLLIRFKNRWWSLCAIWFLCGVSLIVDYPNLFLMAPIGVAAVLSMFSITKKKTIGTIISLHSKLLFTFIGVILPIVVFGMANFYSYGNPMQLAGTVPYIAEIDENGEPVIPLDEEGNKVVEDLSEVEAQSSVTFFHPRNIVNGLYIHTLSIDRSVFIYTPVILFGLLGAYLLYKRNNQYLQLLVGIAAVNLILYSMWGDPWGGWAFGSRYLIPTYAILAIFIAIALSTYAKNKILLIIFGIIMSYSIAVNTLGALTSNANPPRVQILALEEQTGIEQKYTYERNINYLINTGSKSFIYNTYVKNYITPIEYYLIIAGLITIVSGSLIVTLAIKK